MDVFNILVIVALIYLFSSIKRRHRGGEAPEEPERPEERPDEPGPEGSSRQSGPEPSAEASPESYDYGEFRRKLRKAWKLEETAPGETSAGTKTEADGQREPSTPVEEKSAPQPVPRAEPRPAPPAPRRPSRTQEAPRVPPVPGKRPQPAVSPAARPAPIAAASDAYGRTWERADPAAVPKVSATAGRRKRWTEKDARQWVMYDAVFGEPRSRRPWMPQRRRAGK